MTLRVSLAALVVGGVAHADEPEVRWDAASMSDPLEMARWVARRGDAAVLATLGAEAPPAEQIRGAMGSRWMIEPERALPRLAELAGGTDPRVAPTAAAAAHHIASALDPRVLEAREATRGPLDEGRAAFEALASDETIRPDLARLAAFTAEQLRALSSAE